MIRIISLTNIFERPQGTTLYSIMQKNEKVQLGDFIQNLNFGIVHLIKLGSTV